MRTTLFLCLTLLIAYPSATSQRMDIGFRFGFQQTLIGINDNSERITQPYADFFNSYTVLNSFETSQNVIDLFTAYAYWRYHFKNTFFVFGEVGYSSFLINADVTLYDEVIYPEGLSDNFFAFEVFSTPITLNLGANLSRGSRWTPTVYGGLTYTRNWTEKFVTPGTNVFLISLANFESLSADILSGNLGFSVRFFEFSFFSLEFRRNLLAIDVDEVNPFYNSLSHFITTIRIPVIHLDPISRKNKRELKRLNRSFK